VLIFSVKIMSKAYGVNQLGSIEKPANPDTILSLIALHESLPKTGNAKGMPCIGPEDLRRGLSNEEFGPFCQPKVGLLSGKVKGIEAFVICCAFRSLS
jgi:hypothetical protein